jgi:TolB-like protein
MKKLICLLPILFLVGCAPTSSVMVNHDLSATATIAVIPLEGEFGQQASDLIAEQLAINGIPTIERAQIDAVLREHEFRGNDNFDQSSLAEYGRLLGVKKVFIGTITTIRGPLYSFPHVNITLKVVDVATGKVSWIGRYGNSLWTSAISTQGDIQRGAKHIVKEFIKVHGKKF